MGYYFNLPPIISVILLIIPFTAWLCGFLSRCQEGRYIAAIIRFFFGWICWICDLILTLLNGCQVTLLDVIKQ
jgi:hypothetical protein